MNQTAFVCFGLDQGQDQVLPATMKPKLICLMIGLILGLVGGWEMASFKTKQLLAEEKKLKPFQLEPMAGTMMKLDRVTGESWIINGGEWQEMKTVVFSQN